MRARARAHTALEQPFFSRIKAGFVTLILLYFSFSAMEVNGSFVEQEHTSNQYTISLYPSFTNNSYFIYIYIYIYIRIYICMYVRNRETGRHTYTHTHRHNYKQFNNSVVINIDSRNHKHTFDLVMTYQGRSWQVQHPC